MKAIVIVLSILAGAWLFAFLFFWGNGQSITVDEVESKLQTGMTVSDTLSALGVDAKSTELRKDQWYQLSGHGVGSYFHPQHAIVLGFKQGVINEARVTWHFRADERSYSIWNNPESR